MKNSASTARIGWNGGVIQVCFEFLDEARLGLDDLGRKLAEAIDFRYGEFLRITQRIWVRGAAASTIICIMPTISL